MDRSLFFDRLYPLQDVLQVLSAAETGSYLSGGTAASRGYLQHRFSEDLDLFVNDDPSFGLWAARFIDKLSARSGWTTRVLRGLLSASRADWELTRWIDAPEPDVFLADLRRLGEELALLPPPR